MFADYEHANNINFYWYQQNTPLLPYLPTFGWFVGLSMIVFMKHDRRIPIPYGPYLAAAGWIAMLWGPEIISRYFDIMAPGL